jgi:hypothetical protein
MSAQQELAGILERLLQLTQAEGAAIEKAGWPALRQIQASKADLRKSFSDAIRKCAREEPSRSGEPVSKSFRAEAARITSLLTRNSSALSAQLNRARARQVMLDQTKRNLLAIQRSYIRPKQPAAWHSYS